MKLYLGLGAAAPKWHFARAFGHSFTGTRGAGDGTGDWGRKIVSIWVRIWVVKRLEFGLSFFFEDHQNRMF